MISGSVSTTRLGLAMAAASCCLRPATSLRRSLFSLRHWRSLSLVSLSRFDISSLAFLSQARPGARSSARSSHQGLGEEERIVLFLSHLRICCNSQIGDPLGNHPHSPGEVELVVHPGPGGTRVGTGPAVVLGEGLGHEVRSSGAVAEADLGLEVHALAETALVERAGELRARCPDAPPFAAGR